MAYKAASRHRNLVPRPGITSWHLHASTCARAPLCARSLRPAPHLRWGALHFASANLVK